MSLSQSILWTGGWDSTFQLVRSLITGTANLQPIYLVDKKRASTAMELRAMEQIRQKIRADFPERASFLLPVQFVAVSDLVENKKISTAFAAVRNQKRIGIQYEWLARFCHQFGVSDLELCIHRDDKAHDVLQHVVAVKEGAPNTYRVSEMHAGTPEFNLFKPFSFPVFDLTKLEMREIAEDLGFGSILELTWFCHAPRNGKPCGVCNPCRFTIDEGLGSRVPAFRRVKGTLYWNARGLARAGMNSIPFRQRSAGLPVTSSQRELSSENSFGEFWPRYLKSHRLPGTRMLHYFAALLGTMSAVDAILAKQPLIFVCGIAVSYMTTIFAHWFEAGNYQPLAKVNAFWSAVAYLRICWLALAGGLGREFERHGILVVDERPSRAQAPRTQQFYRLSLFTGSAVGLAIVLWDVDDLWVAPHSLVFPVLQLGVPAAAFMMALLASLAPLPRVRSDASSSGLTPAIGRVAPRSFTRHSSMLRVCFAFLVVGATLFAVVELIERELVLAASASIGAHLTSAPS